jgi:hypothetical protein
MRTPLYSPWRFEIANFSSSFCLLPQVILYTQAPENQKVLWMPLRFSLQCLEIGRVKRQFAPNNFNEAFGEGLAVLTNLFRVNCASFPPGFESVFLE